MSAEQAGARSDELRQLADALSAVTRAVDVREGEPLDRLSEAALEAVPAAEAVSLTVLQQGRFETRASTHDLARRADALQYELGRGPCVDAVLENTTNLSNDVATDPQWGEWGPRVAREVGVGSVLAYRLRLEGEQEAIAGLNLYSTRVHAFDQQALHRGVVLATHGSLLMTAVMARDVAANLAESLQGNREIGVAMGVLMHRHRVSREQAFQLLRLASQETGTPLSEIATTVADAGDVSGLQAPLGAGGEERSPAR